MHDQRNLTLRIYSEPCWSADADVAQAIDEGMRQRRAEMRLAVRTDEDVRMRARRCGQDLGELDHERTMKEKFQRWAVRFDTLVEEIARLATQARDESSRAARDTQPPPELEKQIADAVGYGQAVPLKGQPS